MCNFLSAIYTRTGKLICQPAFTNSHSELLEFAQINERCTTAPVQQFVRLELRPPDDHTKLLDFSVWREHIDESELPEWFDSAVRYEAFSAMRDILAAAVIEDGAGWYYGRLLIVVSGAIKCRACYVIALNSAQVKAYNSAQVEAYNSARVEALNSAQVKAYGSAQVKALNSAQVKAYGSAQVKAYGSAQVEAYNSAQVEAYGSARVKAYGSAQVNDQR